MSVLVIAATFVAASVEWVEALTIVLAVGIQRGWRAALLGTLVALVALVILVAVFGAAVTTYVPIRLARGIVGVFLLLFGLRWLHKAILRSAGVVALHDEARAFEKVRQGLGGRLGARGALDWQAAATAFNGVLLEGLEVVFIVVALGGLNNLSGAAVGAVTSAAVVVSAGVALRRPLTRVPENLMKYTVGVMLTSFGTFFAGGGIGVDWWHDDLALLPLVAAYALGSMLLVFWLGRRGSGRARELVVGRLFRRVLDEIWRLFVGDGGLALGALVAILGVGLLLAHAGASAQSAGPLLAAAVLVVLATAVYRHSRDRP